MPDTPDIFDDVSNAVVGNVPKLKKLGDTDVASSLDDEFSNLGYSPAARLSILGDVGRENNWNPQTIFNGHSDPANQAYNRGIISWQGDRQAALNDYLKQQGVYGKGDDSELRGMARFMDSELQSKYPKAYNRIKNANDTRRASAALQGYIRYSMDPKYNTPDPEFMTKRNREWAMKAQKLGLAQDDPFGQAANASLDQSEADPFDAVNSAYLDNQGPTKQVPGLPNPNPLPEPQQTLQTPQGINPPSLAETQPTVPETMPTIMSQISSANALSSPRAAVLLTDPGQMDALAPQDLRGLQPVQTPNGTLLVNPEKVKALGIKGIPAYIKQNGIAGLIGKVEDHEDTSTGLAVRTEDANGNELSTSKVSPNAIQPQAQADLAQFPNAKNQKVVNAQDAVQLRQGDIAKQLDTLNQIGQASANQQAFVPPKQVVKPLVPKRQYSEADFKQWADYNKVPMNAETRKSFEGELSQSAKDNFGKVGASINPSDFSTNGTPVTSPDLQQQVAPGQTVNPREFGKPNENLAAEIGTTGVDPKAKPEDKLRTALNAQLSKYDVTPQESEVWLKSPAGQKQLALLATKPNVDKVGVAYSALADIKGPDAAKLAIRNEQSQAANGLLTPKDLHVGENWSQEDADWLKQTIGERPAEVVGALLGGGGDTARSLAGIARYVPTSDVHFFDPSNPTAAQTVQDWADSITESSDALRQKTQGEGVASQIIQIAEPNQWARFILLSKLPGGAITALGVDRAAQKAGQKGSSNLDVLKEAGKGVTIGAILHFSPLGGKLARYGTARVIQSEVGTQIVDKAGTLIATLGGVNAAEKAFGSSDGQAENSAVVATIIQAYGLLKGHIIGQRIRTAGPDGKTADYTVTPEGEIKRLTGDVQAQPDVVIYPPDKSAYERGALPAPKLPRLGETNVDQYGQQGEYTEPKALPAPKQRGNPLENPAPSDEAIQSPDSSIEADRVEQPNPKAVDLIKTDSRAQAILSTLEPNKTYTNEEVRALVNKSGRRFNQKAIDAALIHLYGAQVVETLPGNRVRLIDTTAKPQDLQSLAKQQYGQNAEVQQSSAPLAKSENVPPTETTPPEEPGRVVLGKSEAAPEATDLKTELHQAYKKHFELPVLDPAKAFHRAKLQKPVKVTFETESGQQITKTMTAEARQRQIENKGKALQRLTDCLHS
jgi:hypothetical protein